jgi:putative ABC transport system ATP-binding protein
MSEYLLQLNNVRLEFPGLIQPIIQEVNYQVKIGDFVVLLGSNGSGKSSLLKLLDRRYQETGGEIIFAKRNLAKYQQSELARQIITLTQNCQDSLFTSLTVLENCLLAQERCPRKKPAIFTCNMRDFFKEYLAQFNSNLPTKLNEITINLSGGEQQALVLALSMLHPPKLLLLDEHTSALDPQAAANLMRITDDLIRKHRITCILTTHDLDIAVNYGNKILALRGGKIHRCIEKRFDTQLSQQELLTMCY